jgi:hypothetical protein
MNKIEQLLLNNTDTLECIRTDQSLILDKIKDLQELLNKFDKKINKNQNVSFTNKSPLRYPGGKTRACKILEEILLKYFDVEKYGVLYSPFFGGGSFEFHLQNKFKFDIVCNDKFKPLYNFWSSCKNNKIKLCERLYLKKDVTKGEFSSIRASIMNEENSLIQAYFYY